MDHHALRAIRRRPGRGAALALALSASFAAIVASASALALPLTTATAGRTTAGAPVATQVLLCGTLTPGTAKAAGASSIAKVSGAQASGSEYPYSGASCDSNSASSIGMFTWTVAHSSVNTTTERGTEHGIAMLSSDADKAAGFNGQITNYDFGSAADPCGSRQVYYASGHAFDGAGSCSASGAGNFNTHGGAATGDHFRGQYGTVVYQDANDNSCKPGSASYCFEAVIEGQTN